MELKGKQFVVEKVYSQSLGELTDEHAHQEGYDSVEEYKNKLIQFTLGCHGYQGDESKIDECR